MAYQPLILRGNLTIDTVSVRDQLTEFKFMGKADTIAIPQTFGVEKSYAGGGSEYEMSMGFIQDVDTTAVSMILWDALDTVDKTIVVAGSLREGAVSASNPLFTATAIVVATTLGGEVNTVGTDSVTFPLTGRPVKSTGA